MKPQAAAVFVEAWEADGILLERYVYTAGAVNPLPKHSHEAYQFGLSANCQGEYWYRGEQHIVPIGSLSVIHSGEIHAPSDRTSLPQPANFNMAHISPAWLLTVAAEMSDQPATAPFFPETIDDLVLNRLFLNLQARVNRRCFQLEKDIALWQFLTYLIAHYDQNRSAIAPTKPIHNAVQRVRDYLHTHYADDISLETLAAIAGLSRFHICRIFKRELGVTPTVYQIQLRIAHAKRLLVRGVEISTVATMTGFYDQSHFGRYFKQLVGTTPGSYAN